MFGFYGNFNHYVQAVKKTICLNPLGKVVPRRPAPRGGGVGKGSKSANLSGRRRVSLPRLCPGTLYDRKERGSPLGHLERSPPERLSGRCRIGQGTSAGAFSGDGLAPIRAVRGARARSSSTLPLSGTGQPTHKKLDIVEAPVRGRAQSPAPHFPQHLRPPPSQHPIAVPRFGTSDLTAHVGWRR